MKKIKLLNIIIVLLLMGCEQAPIGQIAIEGIKPGPISNAEVTPLPGGAKISYTFPTDKDISYIRAEYIRGGKKVNARASLYTNYITIEGLNTSDKITVNVYVVDHSYNESIPVTVEVTPLEPPIKTILSSAKIVGDFGGVTALWSNTSNTEIGATILFDKGDGKLLEKETFYSLLKNGEHTFREYKDTLSNFGLFFTDKWGNKSDTLRITTTPIYETKLNKKLFKRLALPGDDLSYNGGNAGTFGFDKLYDGVIHNRPYFYLTDFDMNKKLPVFFTLDLGQKAKLSRYLQNPVFDGVDVATYYGYSNVRVVELWGTDQYEEGKNSDYWKNGGEWEQKWHKLLYLDMTKPEETALALYKFENGFEFKFSLSLNQMRYIRYKVLNTYGGTSQIFIDEVTFWGNDKPGQ